MSENSTNTKSALKFLDYYVNHIEFYRNAEFRKEPVDFDFHIKRDITYLEDEKNSVLVTLDTEIFRNPEENNFPFSINISLTGLFEIEGVLDSQTKRLAEVNAVAILFPYVRAIVSTYSANANVTPIILPPINVVNLLSMKEEQKPA